MHWADILRIQAQSYDADTLEEETVLRSKCQSAPHFNVVCLDENHRVLGYLLNHPWDDEEPPGLHETIQTDKAFKSWHLHDLAISPFARGKGVANMLVQHVITQLQTMPIESISLIAVQGSAPFWSRYGFTVQKTPAAVSASYGEAALWMKRML